ncbi:hypothetical protein SBI_02196 [Streptomyces bingchenggensis BCW-1]|uniref:Uncharacterized protein n=1 Tax=Streptomyces bingchenggensis (strain BCW-1) TaxID=749414 RepID=D7BTA2_STRBB|nr:hypothetical protein SBI_02196 [Streptomyces bingchenggensis BCW-1]
MAARFITAAWVWDRPPRQARRPARGHRADGATTATTGWVRVGVDGHPYGGRRALLWLIEAAGGYDMDLP